jgi:hypothetical protein
MKGRTVKCRKTMSVKGRRGNGSEERKWEERSGEREVKIQVEESERKVRSTEDVGVYRGIT